MERVVVLSHLEREGFVFVDCRAAGAGLRELLCSDLQREDLNPVEEALAYSALVERFGLTQDQLSKEVGKSRSAIANMLRLLDLPEEVLTLLKDGKITTGHARAILGLNKDEQMVLLAQRVEEKGLSVREVEKLVRKIITEEDAEILTVKDDAAVQRRVYMRDLERRAMDMLGRRVKINQTTKKKTVELTFDSDADLEELLQRHAITCRTVCRL